VDVSFEVLYKGICLPEEPERVEGQRKYPEPEQLLLHNPFAKPKKKKKKGKKKRK